MQNYLEKEQTLLTSKLDYAGKLRPAGLLDLFMDLAAEQAERMGVGYEDMLAHRAFWLAVRTRIRIYKTPGMLDQVRVKTWPGTPGQVKCNRYYTLTRDGETLAEGGTGYRHRPGAEDRRLRLSRRACAPAGEGVRRALHPVS